MDFEGRVLDEATGSPLPYVNIGVVNKPIGTVSDTEGNFILNLNKVSADDTIRVSLVGYAPIGFPVSFISLSPQNSTFYLAKNEIEIDEVNIVGKGRKQRIIGRKTTGGLLQATFNPSKAELREKLGTEIGMKMNYSGKSPAVLKDFNWYFSSNNFDYLKFRVNVYTLKDGLPHSLHSDREITLEVVRGGTGWINVDLTPYDIVVDKDFVISLQWLAHRSTGGEAPRIWIPGTLSPFNSIYYRDGSQDKWKGTKAKISYYVTLLSD